MKIIDFTEARKMKLHAAAREKNKPYARYKAMQDALVKEDLPSMENIVQYHALEMAYQLVDHSPKWGTLTGDFSQQMKSAVEAVVPVLGDMILAGSVVPGSVRMTGRRYSAAEVGQWAARRLVLDYVLILIDDRSCPDDWLDIDDEEPLREIFVYLGYSLS